MKEGQISLRNYSTLCLLHAVISGLEEENLVSPACLILLVVVRQWYPHLQTMVS